MCEYLKETKPSWYDLDKSWCLTIGKHELERLAWGITKYCQEHGDHWQPVPVEAVAGAAYWQLSPDVEMRESWLRDLQSVRRPMVGPPELIRCEAARGGFQLRYPNGRLIAACFAFTDEELRRFMTTTSP